MQLLTKEELREQLLTARNELKQARADIPQWISVKDRLPKQNTDILASTKTKGVQKGKYINYKRPTIYYFNCENQFTHWMPLPQPPKG